MIPLGQCDQRQNDQGKSYKRHNGRFARFEKTTQHDKAKNPIALRRIKSWKILPMQKTPPCMGYRIADHAVNDIK